MIVSNFKKNIKRYLISSIVICLIFSKPAISLDYQHYEKWVENFFIYNFSNNVNSKFIKNIINKSKLKKNDFYKIDKIINRIHDKDFINPENYFDINKLLIRSQKAIKLSEYFEAELNTIETKFEIPKSIILSIWAVESDFGNAELPFSSLKAIVFHIYKEKRKKYFMDELKSILVIIANKKIDTDKILGSSYGAMGQPQFMPSNYLKYGVDYDNDGKVDLWDSEVDILASIANFLSSFGWEKNLKWGTEVTKTEKFPCYLEGPDIKKSLMDWKSYGIIPVDKNSFKNLPYSTKTSLLMPKGEYGPKFLVTKNFYVLKKYNFSDFYALYVSTLANLIEGKKLFKGKWIKTTKLNYKKILELQHSLTKKGLDVGELDGLIGFKTRRSIGKNQEELKQKITCYPK